MGHGKRFCSDACGQKASAQRRKPRVNVQRRKLNAERFAALDPIVGRCEECSAPIERHASCGHQKKFCSLICRNRARRSRDLPKIKAREKAHYAANREKIIAQARAYALADPTATRARHRAWTKTENGRLAVKANGEKRRARELGAGGSFTAQEFRDLCLATGCQCLKCHQELPIAKLTADHVVALINGGAGDISNIQPLCARCNAQKGRKTENYLIDFPFERAIAFDDLHLDMAA